jgi:PleD family two-component response regulator
MLTNVGTATATLRSRTDAPLAQKVVIVNGSAEILELLETVLDAGHYDVVFVESSAHAYSQIKRVQPNLVILCLRIDDVEGFHVLSMLKLDGETRDIPVLTYTTECDGHESDEEVSEPSDNEMFTPKPAVWMN